MSSEMSDRPDEMRLFLAPTAQMMPNSKLKWSVLALPSDNLVRGIVFHRTMCTRSRTPAHRGTSSCGRALIIPTGTPLKR